MKLNSSLLTFAGTVLMFGSIAIGQTGSDIAAVEPKSCAKLRENLIAQICVGDLVQSRRGYDDVKPAVQGMVSKIESGVAENGKPMSILSVQTSAGVARLTTRGLVFVTPGTCVQDSRSRDRICLGETFKNEEDARVYQVTGFSVSEGDSFDSSGVIVRDLADKSNYERIFNTSTIFESHAVAVTGIMTRHGSCDSEMPFLDKMSYGKLPGCATKEAADRLKTSCSNYCAGKGQIQRGHVSAETPKCEVQPNMFPPHKKVCSITITAKCSCN